MKKLLFLLCFFPALCFAQGYPVQGVNSFQIGGAPGKDYMIVSDVFNRGQWMHRDSLGLGGDFIKNQYTPRQAKSAYLDSLKALNGVFGTATSFGNYSLQAAGSQYHLLSGNVNYRGTASGGGGSYMNNVNVISDRTGWSDIQYGRPFYSAVNFRTSAPGTNPNVTMDFGAGVFDNNLWLHKGSYFFASDGDFPQAGLMVRQNINALNDNSTDTININFFPRNAFSGIGGGHGWTGVFARFDTYNQGSGNSRKNISGVINMFSGAIDAHNTSFERINYYSAGSYKTFGNPWSTNTVQNMVGFYASPMPSTAVNRWGFYQESASDKNFFGGDIYWNKLKPVTGKRFVTVGSDGKLDTTSAGSAGTVSMSLPSGEIPFGTGSSFNSTPSLKWDNANNQLYVKGNITNTHMAVFDGLTNAGASMIEIKNTNAGNTDAAAGVRLSNANGIVAQWYAGGPVNSWAPDGFILDGLRGSTRIGSRGGDVILGSGLFTPRVTVKNDGHVLVGTTSTMAATIGTEEVSFGVKNFQVNGKSIFYSNTTNNGPMAHFVGTTGTEANGSLVEYRNLKNSEASNSVASFLAPNMLVGQDANLYIGRSYGSNYNAAKLMFYYNGDGSPTNELRVGFWGNNNVFSINGTGDVKTTGDVYINKLKPTTGMKYLTLSSTGKVDTTSVAGGGGGGSATILPSGEIGYGNNSGVISSPAFTFNGTNVMTLNSANIIAGNPSGSGGSGNGYALLFNSNSGFYESIELGFPSDPTGNNIGLKFTNDSEGPSVWADGNNNASPKFLKLGGSGGLKFFTGGTTTRATLNTSGRWLFNTSTDDGSNILQVAGGVRTNALTFGAGLSNVAAAGDSMLVKASNGVVKVAAIPIGGGGSSLTFSSEFNNVGGAISINQIDQSKIAGLSANNWNNAYNDRIVGAMVTASGNQKTLTLTQTDGGTLNATWTDETGTSSGEANTAFNLGDGWALYQGKQGVQLNFRSIVPGNGISMKYSDDVTTNSIVISATKPDLQARKEVLNYEVALSPYTASNVISIDLPEGVWSVHGQALVASPTGNPTFDQTSICELVANNQVWATSVRQTKNTSGGSINETNNVTTLIDLPYPATITLRVSSPFGGRVVTSGYGTQLVAYRVGPSTFAF